MCIKEATGGKRQAASGNRWHNNPECGLKLVACSCSGFTLIEMIVILVVIAIAAVGLFGVFMRAVSGSADPMLNMQAIAIAQGYLEEALLQPFLDPNEPEIGANPSDPTTGCEEGLRQNYDDVQDYNCIFNEVPTDQFGNSLAGLGAYRVDITVTPGVTLGTSNPVNAHQVVVNVSHSSLPTTIILTGYRTNTGG